MEILRTQRRHLKLSLTRLSALTGIPRQTLGDLEAGRYLPGPLEAERLARTLQLPCLPDPTQTLSQRSLRRLHPCQPWQLPPVDVGPWERLKSDCAGLLRRLCLPEQVMNWMELCLPTDSLYEALALCTLAAEGAQGVFANPHACGYRYHAVVDRLGRPLGERLLAGLLWKPGARECLLWPQVSIASPRGNHRLDMLVLFQGCWLDVEVDGRQHQPELDEFRRRLIGLPEIRVTTHEVRALRFAERLAEGLVLHSGRHRNRQVPTPVPAQAY